MTSDRPVSPADARTDALREADGSDDLRAALVESLAAAFDPAAFDDPLMDSHDRGERQSFARQGATNALNGPLADLEARLADAERRASEAITERDAAQARADAAQSEIAGLMAEVERVRAALEPFAHYAEHRPGADFGDGEIGEYYHEGIRRSIRTSDLRAARAALTERTTDADAK